MKVYKKIVKNKIMMIRCIFVLFQINFQVDLLGVFILVGSFVPHVLKFSGDDFFSKKEEGIFLVKSSNYIQG